MSIEDVNLVLNVTLEELDKAIPEDLKAKLQDPQYRKDLLKMVGPTAFLDQDGLKFPVKDEKGAYVCQLIYAAYLRAKMNIGRHHKNGQPDSYYQSIMNKAKILFGSNKCDSAMNIHLKEDIELDYVTFFEGFDLTNTENKELFQYVD